MGRAMWCLGSGFSVEALAPEPAGLFSEGGEVIKLHIEGSITIPTTGIKWVLLWEYQT